MTGENTGDASVAGASSSGRGAVAAVAVRRCRYIALLFRPAVGHGSVGACTAATHAATATAGTAASSGSSRVLRFGFEVVRG